MEGFVNLGGEMEVVSQTNTTGTTTPTTTRTTHNNIISDTNTDTDDYCYD